jgi:hypothetical protein
MALILPYEMPQLFKHSKDVSTGLGKERLAGEIIVNINGAGDFTSIEEALKVMENGGTIKLKEGTYTLKNKITIPSNTSIIGDGNASIIKTTTSLTEWIDFQSKSNIIFKDLCLYLFTDSSTAPIRPDGADNIVFERVLFKIGNANYDGIFFTDIHATTKLRINNCVTDTTEASTARGCIFASEIKFGTITNNRFDTLDLIINEDMFFTNCIVKGNYFESIRINNGSNNNVVIGNQTDQIISNLGAGNQIANNIVF